VLTELQRLLLPSAPAVMQGKPWAALSRAEKRRVMKEVVQPRMQEVFTRLDPVRYAKVECTLCHRGGAKPGKFQMPNPELRTLDFANKLRAERAEKPVVARFVFKHVVPEMMLALGVSPFDMTTRQGFGCQSCHPVKN
jgi:hypothetical protein